ncbi:hypothetical protein ACIBQ6_00015 [Nonomuraea sp. NPDC049655]|uniref:hypothetical protein n=1 Tax=Nonomuraea sp. NPDC049655 TaxID=3364355 RepID=UPI0037B497B4
MHPDSGDIAGRDQVEVDAAALDSEAAQQGLVGEGLRVRGDAALQLGAKFGDLCVGLLG